MTVNGWTGCRTDTNNFEVPYREYLPAVHTLGVDRSAENQFDKVLFEPGNQESLVDGSWHPASLDYNRKTLGISDFIAIPKRLIER